MDTMMWVIPPALALAVGMAVVAWRLCAATASARSARGHVAATGLRTRTSSLSAFQAPIEMSFEPSFGATVDRHLLQLDA